MAQFLGYLEILGVEFEADKIISVLPFVIIVNKHMLQKFPNPLGKFQIINFVFMWCAAELRPQKLRDYFNNFSATTMDGLIPCQRL